MWKEKSHIKYLRRFSVDEEGLACVIRGGQIQFYNFELTESYSWVAVGEKYGQVLLIYKNLILFHPRRKQIEVFRKDTGKSIDLIGDDDKMTNFHSKGVLDGIPTFFALERKNNIYSLVKYICNDGKFEEEWKKKIRINHFFPLKKENAIFFSTDNFGEIVKLDSRTGKTILKKQLDLEENIYISRFYGIHKNNLILWRSDDVVMAIDIDNGKVSWVIDEIPKPSYWAGSNIMFHFVKLIEEENILIGFYNFHIWKFNLNYGTVSQPEDYTKIFNGKMITDQAPDYVLEGDNIIFSDFYRRKLVSFNRNTIEINSISDIPLREGIEDFSTVWQGPIIQGDNCYVLDNRGVLHIFERT